jgi:hypothetical protein
MEGVVMALFDETPDKPKGFGFKVLWFAVKAADPASVLDALEFGERTPANWASGLATVYRAWSGSNGEVLANLGERTPEVAKLGIINLTGLSPSDAVDRIFKIVSEQQDEADALVASGLSRREALARVRQNGRGSFPSETDVVQLAALWSIDPSRLEEQDHPVGSGLAARLPKDLMQ